MSPSSDPHFMSRSVIQVSFRLTSSPSSQRCSQAAAHLCLWGQLYNASLFALSHSTCLQNRTDSGDVSLSTRRFICSLVVLLPAEQSRTHGGTLPGLVPTFTPRVPLYCFCSILSDGLFPINRIYTEDTSTIVSEAVIPVYVQLCIFVNQITQSRILHSNDQTSEIYFLEFCT